MGRDSRTVSGMCRLDGRTGLLGGAVVGRSLARLGPDKMGISHPGAFGFLSVLDATDKLDLSLFNPPGEDKRRGREKTYISHAC